MNTAATTLPATFATGKVIDPILAVSSNYHISLSVLDVNLEILAVHQKAYIPSHFFTSLFVIMLVL